MQNDRDDKDEEGWEYGDVWKQGQADESPGEESIRYVEILRGDTGTGYDDTLLMDLVVYLGSMGIRSSFDSFSVGMEPAAIKSYVLKVEAGKEEEALGYLRDKFKGSGL